MHRQSAPESSFAERVQQAEATYPSVRYFQIHFEFLQEQFQQTLAVLESMQVQIRQLEQQLSVQETRQDRVANCLQSLAGKQEHLPR